MVRDWQLASGRYFSGSEEAGAGKVVILGSTVAHELFAPGEDPIGAQIRIMKVPLEVVGVLDRKGPAQDDVAFVPLTTAKLRFLGSASNINRDSVAYIIAKVAADGQMAGARTEIENLLRQRHRIPAGQEDDFKVQDPAAAMEAQQGAIRTVALLLVAIASVSLLVG
ncbi:ABC-type antimicrobial peptide transport system permease subunit [Bradyrhizobium sp. GM7.3]